MGILFEVSCEEVSVGSALANCGRPKVASGLGQFVRNVTRIAKGLEVPLENISEIVLMTLSDHVDFADIARELRIAEKQVKALTRNTLRPGCYRA